MREGHDVVVHARSRKRASAAVNLALCCARIVIDDLSSAIDTRLIADQMNAIGRMDAVIHNAGIYLAASRGETRKGHATTLAVNTLAPYTPHRVDLASGPFGLS